MTDALKACLTKFANKDLSTARRNGVVGIYGTQVGFVEVSYNDGIYTVAGNGVVLSQGKAATARAYIMSIYTVVTE